MNLESFLNRLKEALAWEERPALTPGTVLADQWDSMGQINVIAMLDEQFHVSLEIEELQSIVTVQDILDILASRNIRMTGSLSAA